MPNEKGSLQGRKNIDRTGVRTRMQVDRAGFEPAASALRTRRSYRADLPALWHRAEKIPRRAHLELSVRFLPILLRSRVLFCREFSGRKKRGLLCRRQNTSGAFPNRLL